MESSTIHLDIRVKRIYDPASKSDGVRILVDRLWPRGLKKSEAHIDRWLRNLAPTPELRRWFGHDVRRWEAFRQQYAGELQVHGEQVAELRRLAREGPVTLLFAAHDECHNNAVVLRDVLLK